MASVPPAPFRLLHPLHAILLAFPIALFSAALVSDITYIETAEIQWTNFSAWLITGGLVFGAPALLWALILLVRRRGTGSRDILAYFLLAALMWVAALVNAFQHSRDAWSSVGTTGLILSIVSTLAALAAGWVGHSGWRSAL
jgi:uncharacterized membrane protein